MSIGFNINDESAQDIIEQSFQKNIFDEYAKDFISLLIDYKTQDLPESIKANIMNRYIDLLTDVIYSNDDWIDFCESLYNRSLQFWGVNDYATNVFIFIQDFVAVAQSDISYSNNIILGKYPFDPPSSINPAASFLEYKPIVQGNLEDTIGMTEEDQEELEELLADIGEQPVSEQTDGSTNYGHDMSLNITEAILQYVEFTVQSLIASGGINVLNKLGINQDTLEIAQRIVDITDAAIFKIQAIIPCIPKNIQFVPDFTGAMSSIATSLKDMFMGMWIGLENVYYETINQAITNLPSLEEAQKDLIEASIMIGLQMIDVQCIKYTGHTLVELYYMCNSLIQMYKQYKESREQLRQLESEGYDVDVKATYSLNTEELKRQLKEELENASDMMFNAFIILQIRDAFYNVKELISEFHNIDLNVLTENMNSLQDLMDLLDEIGLNDNAWTVSLAEAIELGINDMQNQFNGLVKQAALVGIATGVNVVNDVIANTSINADAGVVTATKVFDFKSNLNENTEGQFEITLVIYQNPTVVKTQKNIIKVLTNAVDSQNEKIFDAGEVTNIMTQLKDAYSKRRDRDIQMRDFVFKIHFEIEGFNQKSLLPDDVYQIVTQALQDLEEKKELEKQQALNTFELGVVTEEYTYDPDLVKRRPTIKLIHDIYALMQKFFPILKTFAVLVSNYKINKWKVQNNASGNIFAMKRVLAKLNNLIKHINRGEHNFYTIRTLKTFDYIDKNIKFIDYYNINSEQDREDEMTLYPDWVTARTCEIDKDKTKKLYDYLQLNNLDNKDLNVDNDTTLYIDVDALKEQRSEMDEGINALSQFFGEDSHLFVNYPETTIKDGTIDGIDKIEIIDNEVYYSDSSLPVIGSQILRAYQKNKDVSI